ncbi:RNA polymerase sigma factor (sigma-70 family) [Breznakia sp. PF5-3]|uniref:RNA polymerase sigma factor n=1 Tax=unclassified Breznakia TaxID=2623764 RepID=UPI0024064937|nr:MULTISPECIES: sigma-70 family RNA polymerase sigma factor [unclassified Breznakia]MDF9825627.1 RNA polymerase sigma factor (sigma-70 family) [Breznakia sp. PM6-1]MDF9836459.1 RNA polymerase sigma factor (sigma-70 family) [Breznakia sp. PF5-3]MDF9838628.1 RNA polymerase sigma factor (sigma-70 family) [Breznakia sp. PFB2-8]MDF9860659.1 RNA polymerase sigma factor (sigma-70 family) [Breznakia sp. PH5-24]
MDKRMNKVEEDTIVKAQAGDTDAFSEIYKVYYNRVYFIAYQYYRDSETAKDIVQEVFIRVYRKIKQLKEPVTFNAWLGKVTYSICVNHKRGKLKTIDLGDTMDIEDFGDHNHVSVEEVLENQRIKETIFESLETMSAPLKSVGLLRYYQEFSINEIADILDIPHGTVTSRINRIKKILKVDLENKGITPKNYMLVISPSLLCAAYQELSNKYVLNQASSNNILDSILHSPKLLLAGLFPKIATVGVLSAAITTGMLLTRDTSSSVSADVIAPPYSREMMIVETAKIEEISYDKNWTNKAIKLNITTSNDNYDQITINDEVTDMISENGNYKIQLRKDGKVIDEKRIKVSNIDIHSPNGTYKQSENTFTYHLNDDLSQIDPTSIRFYKDGVPSEEYHYNVEDNVLTILSVGDTIDTFFISDQAGNELEIIIK